GEVVFDLGAGFVPSLSASLTLNVIPTNGTPLTNIVSVGVQGLPATVTSNLVTAVTNGRTTLGLSVNFPPVIVLANDWVTYAVTVTNTGQNFADNVVLSNTLPADVGLIGVTPANLPFTLVSNAMVFNLGSARLASGLTLFF